MATTTATEAASLGERRQPKKRTLMLNSLPRTPMQRRRLTSKLGLGFQAGPVQEERAAVFPVVPAHAAADLLRHTPTARNPVGALVAAMELTSSVLPEATGPTDTTVAAHRHMANALRRLLPVALRVALEGTADSGGTTARPRTITVTPSSPVHRLARPNDTKPRATTATDKANPVPLVVHMTVTACSGS